MEATHARQQRARYYLSGGEGFAVFASWMHFLDVKFAPRRPEFQIKIISYFAFVWLLFWAFLARFCLRLLSVKVFFPGFGLPRTEF
jgi:hypothetical protein